MQPGVTAGERFRSWAEIRPIRPAAPAGSRPGRARGRQRGADAAQRLPHLRSQHGGGPARRLCRADQLAFHAGGGGLHPGRLRAPRCWWPTADLLAQIAPGIPAGVKVLAVPTPRGDRRGLQRAGREARAAPQAPRPGMPSWRARAQHPAAQGGARQHDLHIGHDRPAQGRAPPAIVARAAGQWPPGRWRATGAYGRSLDRRADERPDVSLRARGLRHGQRAARPQRSSCSRASRRRTCCG